MAERPVFIACTGGIHLVEQVDVEFSWHPGLSLKQKRASIHSLHEAARPFMPTRTKILEISRKAEEALGNGLSSFNLTLILHEATNLAQEATDAQSAKVAISPSFPSDPSTNTTFLECAFQASKVFKYGGPFVDLLSASPKGAKRDPRLQNSGQLTTFQFFGQHWPLSPRTAFYDWLYITALTQHPELAEQLLEYDAFTDIEFNPKRSVNCQARAAALYVALRRRGLLEQAMASQESFLATIQTPAHRRSDLSSPIQHEDVST